MIVRFQPAATHWEREAVREAVVRYGAKVAAEGDTLTLDAELAEEAVLAVAALPGVLEIESSGGPPATLREAILAFTGGAAVVLGLLIVVAANVTASLGRHADPLRTPLDLRPSWPLMPWYAAVDKAPAGVPVPLLFVAAALLLFFWPDVARRFAASRPLLHALVGVAALAAVAGLAALEVLK